MPGVRMTTSQVETGPGGRSIIKGGGGLPDRVALPQHCIEDACTPEEKDILARFTEASEMHKGNYAVIIVDGEPRGRYERVAKKVDPRTYASFEIAAYQWILNQAFGRQSGMLAEMVARMNGERTEINFQDWGARLINSDDPAMALGAAIGSTRALAFALKDAYRDYYEFWRIREMAAAEGRRLTDDEAVRRVRRGQSVRRAYETHNPVIAGRVAAGSKGVIS